MLYIRHKFVVLIKVLYFNLGKIQIMKFKLLKSLSCVTTQVKDLKPYLSISSFSDESNVYLLGLLDTVKQTQSRHEDVTLTIFGANTHVADIMNKINNDEQPRAAKFE